MNFVDKDMHLFNFSVIRRGILNKKRNLKKYLIVFFKKVISFKFILLHIELPETCIEPERFDWISNHYINFFLKFLKRYFIFGERIKFYKFCLTIVFFFHFFIFILFKKNGFSLLTGRIVISNKKRNFEKYLVVSL